ncbi:hypothetical protein [Umezawaea beigongshangensis]|uniref:hypothetical protein n=1 Tax=Umezawaea beigongshangensis TaxID=2780383 RepID=UPI0018F189D8|nr:hypothetical protein [Umezawaea beigongshangensis]
MEVRSIAVEGVGGTRSDKSVLWRDDGRLEVLVHFASPVARGNEFQVLVEID